MTKPLAAPLSQPEKKPCPDCLVLPDGTWRCDMNCGPCVPVISLPLEIEAASKPICEHRSIQLCKDQEGQVVTLYVCGRCSEKFEVKPVEKPQPQPREPMFPKNPIPWGLRARQA